LQLGLTLDQDVGLKGLDAAGQNVLDICPRQMYLLEFIIDSFLALLQLHLAQRANTGHLESIRRVVIVERQGAIIQLYATSMDKLALLHQVRGLHVDGWHQVDLVLANDIAEILHLFLMGDALQKVIVLTHGHVVPSVEGGWLHNHLLLNPGHATSHQHLGVMETSWPRATRVHLTIVHRLVLFVIDKDLVENLPRLRKIKLFSAANNRRLLLRQGI
jgi:hypothetical protein